MLYGLGYLLWALTIFFGPVILIVIVLFIEDKILDWHYARKGKQVETMPSWISLRGPGPVRKISKEEPKIPFIAFIVFIIIIVAVVSRFLLSLFLY